MDSIIFASYKQVVLSLIFRIHRIENHEVLQPLEDVTNRVDPSHFHQVV